MASYERNKAQPSREPVRHITRAGRIVRPPERLIESCPPSTIQTKRKILEYQEALEMEVTRLQKELERDIASIREELPVPTYLKTSTPVTQRMNVHASDYTQEPPQQASAMHALGHQQQVIPPTFSYSQEQNSHPQDVFRQNHDNSPERQPQQMKMNTYPFNSMPRSSHLQQSPIHSMYYSQPQGVNPQMSGHTQQSSTYPLNYPHQMNSKRVDHKQTVDQRQQPELNYIEPTSQREGQANLLSRLADLLSNKRDHLPRMEPDVFTGDLLKFPEWIRSFEVLIEKHTTSAIDRLYYLNKYTAGDAKTAIQWYFTLHSASAYDQAKTTLVKRYGDKFKISEAFRKQMDNWPTIRPGDAQSLLRFSDFLHHNMSAMESISYLRSLNSPEENRKLVRKLPRYLANRWFRIVDEWLYGDPTHRASLPEEVYEGCYPPFSEFCKFVANEARIACSAEDLGVEVKKVDKKSSKSGGKGNEFKPRFNNEAAANSFASEVNNKSEPLAIPKPKEQMPCTLCQGSHTIDKCQDFKAKTLEERKIYARSKGLCFGCLRKGHLYMVCRRRNPQLMYGDLPTSPPCPEDTSKKDKTDKVSSHTIDSSDDQFQNVEGQLHSMVMPLVLYHKDCPNKQIETYALLDNQSNACFISDNLLHELQIEGEPVNLKLKTVLAEKTVTSSLVNGLVVRGVNEPVEVSLPKTYSRTEIPADKSLIPRPETLNKWQHLRAISNKLVPYRDNIEIGLLIGFNCSVALLPREVVSAGDNDPYAIRTVLGWGVTGAVGNCRNSSMEHFSYRTQTKEITCASVRQMFNTDFNEQFSDDKISLKDKRFLRQVEGSIHQKEDGHFEIPLPFDCDNIHLPNNVEVAKRRLASLKRKLLRDTQYRSDYSDFMKEIISKDYAEPVSTDNIQGPEGRTWYLPHHGVYHPQKPKKIRVVFDCSAEYKGQSLNQHLLPGPDLINSLVGILCRFRKDRIALTCDIEAMFHQVSVDPADRDYLRFLWWENGDLSTEPRIFRMAVHLFGATSSPGCVNMALKTTADIFEKDCGSKAAEFVRSDFYVDDGLISVASIEEAQQLIDSTRMLCAKGGFRLHKFTSNAKEVLQHVNEDDRQGSMKNVDLNVQNLPLQSAVGIQWCLESDTLLFRIQLQDKPLTRRGLLSTISSIFDPLGLVAPFMLLGKKLLQEICKTNGGEWDDPLSDDMKIRWSHWRNDLIQIAKLEVPRCYKDEQLGEIKQVELHHFSDACQEGYGQCSYLRLIDDHQNVSTSLVMGKARVAPLKSITIPRLELTAAVTSAKVSNFLNKELKYEAIKHVFWTDSQVVLGYIASDSKRFHIFVANRVQLIRDITSVDQWNYVDSRSNPADIASRGMKAEELKNSSLWWKGPAFLYSDKPLPLGKPNSPLSCDDPEVKRVVVHVTNMDVQTVSFADIISRLDRFSNWHLALKAVALCLRFKNRLKMRTVKRPRNVENIQTLRARLKSNYIPINVDELKEAEREIIRVTQLQAFPKEIESLSKIESESAEISWGKKQNRIRQNNRLSRLDPYVDSDGLIRVGGRIKRANVPQDLAHPVILPKEHHITRLVIAHYHARTGHSGRGITMNEIRTSGYWILKGRSAVAGYIWKCVICRKLRGPTAGQKMADLPRERVEPAPPFTYAGVDFFGPFYVKEGRSEKKRWGVVFTCMSSRAIHLEVAHTLEASSFLNAYRRFIARRGPVRQLSCDRGTNFVGGKGELEAALKEMNDYQIKQELLKDKCDWVEFKFNVPHASHMGGIWERMIKSVRAILSGLLVQHGSQLNDELLLTLLAEVEAVVNSRPLTYHEVDHDSIEPLSPSQILTLKSKVIMPPPGKFVKEDMYCRKRWRRIQFLANEFWSRWKKEYLSTLTARKKWQKPQQNMKKGDIVLLKDENLPRCQWPYAIIVNTYPSEDLLIRKVQVKTATSTYDRPIHKLVFLYRPEEDPVEEP